jgi:hypothetical protein
VGDHYEKRSEEFSDFYVFEYLPATLSLVDKQLQTSKAAGLVKTPWALLTAMGFLKAQEEILRRLNEILVKTKEMIVKEKGEGVFVQ